VTSELEVQAKVDAAQRPGMTTEDKKRIVELERETVSLRFPADTSDRTASCHFGNRQAEHVTFWILFTGGRPAGAVVRCAGTGRPRLIAEGRRAGGHRRGSS
jgi:hypothetical protein